ncbi:hypothetical protein [Xenorhabdus bovienii]|uniref:hypothetical protein n=1 Tax=Xenorhabdus bovienii TaxID=40576 RepID=UPI0023B2FE03|nr:hypothetical protein [Xenorhabdus bovienii]MDE9463564.1 hypothetical protein [Xenorhabdus bovienii]
MGKTIFRTINGRVVPISVDDEFIANHNIRPYIVTPKHQSKDRKLNTKSSFLTPNATCQKCGKDVFYYENSYGSRVLFDALGSPWPIHPCYAEFIEKKRTTTTAESLGWEPVFVEKGVLTSSGGLRIQGRLDKEEIRFIFDEKTFARMRINLEDATALIVFASKEKGKVQTHNGKREFATRYEVVKQDTKPQEYAELKEKSDIFGIKKILNSNYIMIEVISESSLIAQIILKKQNFDRYFLKNSEFMIKKNREHGSVVFRAKSDSHGMFITLNLIAEGVNYLSSDLQDENDTLLVDDELRIVGLLSVNQVEFLDKGIDDILLVIKGSLNSRFHANYLVKDKISSEKIYKIYRYLKLRGDALFILVSENEERINLKSLHNDDSFSFDAVFVSNNVLAKMKKVKELKQTKITAKIDERKTKSVEQQINKLSEQISTAMADAFATAKKRKK